ncbi:MAG: protein kinase [Candidatus Aminicenantes bacterium]|nr:protein kinase [Candidatus Aminicenantes bacterium]
MTDKKIGKYTILGKLGKGGMGIVYKAVDPIIGRTVAIKTIRLDVSISQEEQDEATKRFIREAQSAGNLNHPNIVTIYDVGEDDGLMFIAMEYIEGKTLEESLAESQRFSLEKIVNWINKIGEALDYAHSKGVIHRDIKPGNILIDNQGIPHIVDFGIARIATSTLTMTGTSLGTPSYMAPEQIAGSKVDFRADIFSLGAILYELLTLKKAFSGDSFTSVVYKIMNEEPPPIQNYNDQLPGPLDYVVRKALAKNVDNRYQSCQHLTKELRDPPQSPFIPPPVYEDVSKEKPLRETIQSQTEDFEHEEGKRKKTVLIALLSSLMILIVGITAVLYFFVFKTDRSAPGGGTNPSLSTQSVVPKTEPEPKIEEPPTGRPLEKPLSEETENTGITPLLESGTQAFNSGDFDACIQQMEDVLKIDPNNSSAIYFINEAEKGKTAQRNQNSIRITLDLAMNAYQIKDFQECIRQAAIVLNLDESNPEAKKYLINSNLELGILSYKEKNYDLSTLFMNEVLKLEPENVFAKQYKEDVQKNKSDQLKADTIQEVLSSAQKAFERKNYLEVIKQTEVLLSLDPAHTSGKKLFLSAHQQIGLDEFNKRNYEKSVNHMQSILKIDPNNRFAQNYFETASNNIRKQKIDAHLKQAQSYYQQMKYEASLQEAANVLKIEPKNRIAAEYINLAKIQLTPQLLNEMVKQYAESVKTQRLNGFYREVCDPSLFERIRKDTNNLFSLYSNIQIGVSNTSIQFRDSTHVEVSFSQAMTGISQSSGQRAVLSEGSIKWTMENVSEDILKDNWKILNILYSQSSLALRTLIVGKSR